jgi:membrane-associated phospholipid phosphatase
MVGPTRQARERADQTSDYLWYASVGYPVLDVVVAGPLVHRDLGMTYQLSLMNLQAFSAVSVWAPSFHKTVGRTRPNVLGCAEKGPGYDDQCGSKGQYLSFPSGHAGVSMTGAGLSCAHHLQGHLYRSQVADGVACGAAVSVAATVGGLRITADRHWMSDTLVGAGLGFATGYGLPTILYYRPFWRALKRQNVATAPAPDGLLVTGIVAPLPGGAGAVVQGRF